MSDKQFWTKVYGRLFSQCGDARYGLCEFVRSGCNYSPNIKGFPRQSAKVVDRRMVQLDIFQPPIEERYGSAFWWVDTSVQIGRGLTKTAIEWRLNAVAFLIAMSKP